MCILLSVINFSASNLFRIELIFRSWLSFHFLKPRFCVEGSYFRQWRWQFLQAIIVAQSSQNSFVFYNCTRSFGFNFKIYRMVSWKWGSIKKESFLRKKLLALFTKFWPNIDLLVSDKWMPSFHKYLIVICSWSINSKLYFIHKSPNFLLMSKILISVLVDGSIADIYIYISNVVLMTGISYFYNIFR